MEYSNAAASVQLHMNDFTSQYFYIGFQSTWALEYLLKIRGISTSSSSASFPTFMWGRCFLWDASIEIGLARPPLTILSPTKRSWCYPTTSALIVLSFFSPAPQSPSLSCLRIRILFSIPCPYHFNLLSCTFLDISPTSNSFIPNSVQHGDSACWLFYRIQSFFGFLYIFYIYKAPK